MQRYNCTGMQRDNGGWVRWEDVDKLLEARRDALERLFEITGKNNMAGVIRVVQFRKTQQDNQVKEIIRLREEIRKIIAINAELHDKDRRDYVQTCSVENNRQMTIRLQKETLAKLRDENKELREELRKSEGMITGYRSTNRELHIETNQLQEENRGRGNRIDQLEREIKHTNSAENIRLHKQLDSQATEIKRLRKVIDEILAINAELQEKLNKDNQAKEIKRLSLASEILLEENRQWKSAGISQKELIDSLRGELRVANADRGRLAREVHLLKGENKELRKELRKKITELCIMDKDRELYKKRKFYICTTNTKIKQLEEEIKKLEKEKRFADLYGALDKERENEDLGAEYSGY